MEKRKFTAKVDVYLAKEEIGNTELLANRTEVTEDYQVTNLKFPKSFKDYFRQQLAKSKHGVIICDAGSCLIVKDPAQIVARYIEYLN